jgi:hypothetical protein
VDDTLEVHLLSSHEREALGQIKAHLRAKNGQCTCARAVGFEGAVVEDFAEQSLVLAHEATFVTVGKGTPVTEKKPPCRAASLAS